MFKIVFIPALVTITWLELYPSLIRTEVLRGPVAPTYRDVAVWNIPRVKYLPGIFLIIFFIGTHSINKINKLVIKGIKSLLNLSKNNEPIIDPIIDPRPNINIGWVQEYFIPNTYLLELLASWTIPWIGIMAFDGIKNGNIDNKSIPPPIPAIAVTMDVKKLANTKKNKGKISKVMQPYNKIRIVKAAYITDLFT